MANEFIALRDVMDAFKVYIPHIENNGITPEIITQLIDEHGPVKTQLKTLRSRYEVSKDGVPILKRVMLRNNGLESTVNNKLNNSFDTDIVDGKNGYFLGNPINITVEKEKVAKSDLLINEIDRMRIRDNLPDKDATLGKRTSIAGYGARLCYISVENDKPVPRIANLKPEEVIFLYKETMSEPTYSLHYYDTVRLNTSGEKENVTIADFYDGTDIQRFVKADGDFVLEVQNIHGFLFDPLFGMENNDELSGEVQKILNLVDAFDRTLSDASNEVEASRLAILLLSNLNMNEDDIDYLKQAGVLETMGEGKASYLTKDVNDTMIENHLDRLNKMIMRISKSVDFSDENFASNLSGVAIKFKTMALEHKSIIAENKMRSTLQYQMKVMCSAWSLLGICDAEDYLNIWFGFKRNLPSNTLEAAQATALLKGNVSERTRLSMLPFVDDVEAELIAMQQDIKEFGNQLEPLNDIDDVPTEVPGADKQEIEA